MVGLNVSQPAPVTAADHMTDGSELVKLNVRLAGLNPAIALKLMCAGLTDNGDTVKDQTLPALVELKPTTSKRQK